jgi:hypothetical protein
LIDVNNKNFVAIPDKNRATAAGGEHSTNMYLNDRFVHRVDGTDGRTKNKLLPAARTSFSGESRNGCFRGASVTHAFPPIPICRTEPARDLLLVFFESTLHVSPDQQLSALQPLTK